MLSHDVPGKMRGNMAKALLLEKARLHDISAYLLLCHNMYSTENAAPVKITSKPSALGAFSVVFA